MSIIGKHVTKNLFAKPFRTFLLLICICCCTFVALLCFDIVGSMELMVKTMLTQITGTSDIIVSDSVGVEDTFDISYEADQLLVYERQDGITKIPEGFYSYFQKDSFLVDTMDYALAYKMRLIGTPLELKKDEAAITPLLADKMGWKEGDTITLTDDFQKQHKYTITEIVPMAGISNGRRTVYLGKEGYAQLTTDSRATMVYIDVLKDEEAKEASKELEKLAYNGHVSLLIDSEENKEVIRQLSILLLLIFAVCFFLVIFVAISVSSRIICERMAVVGTFRSLGLSPSFTTKLLLMESGLYGLLGSGFGVILYALARAAIFNSIFSVNSDAAFEVTIEMTPLNPLAVLGAILLGIGVMCICPLKEIRRTAKMAIRDIIFDNKDTAYQIRKSTVIVGIFCAITAAVTFFMKQNIGAQLICFAMMIVAVSMLFPLLLKLVAKLFGGMFETLNMPVAHMASVECYAKKSTVGSSVLCVTASTLAIIIFIFVSTLGSIYDLHTYDCDVHACIDRGQTEARFSYVQDLEGVKETELLYKYETDVIINDKKQMVTIFGLNEGGYNLFTAIQGCPDTLEHDSILLDSSLARKMGVQMGDEVSVTFDALSYLPITKPMKVAGLVNGYNYDTTGNVMVLSKDMFTDMYHEQPGEILIRCENPEEIVSALTKYSGTVLSTIETIEEYNRSWREKEKGTRGMMIAIIAFGVGLTVIGMVSNQLIGFEGRKRECAVLASTSMTREKLSRMFLLESMIASGISLLIALPTAFVAFAPFKRILENIAAEMNIVYNMRFYVLFLGVLWIVFTGVSLFPIRKLKKMNLAAQLKYE